MFHSKVNLNIEINSQENQYQDNMLILKINNITHVINHLKVVQHINQVIQKNNQILIKKENQNNMIFQIIINLMDRLLILVAIHKNHTIQQKVVNLNN
jgi:hypothetical protein